MAGVLILEIIAVLLALPVVGAVGGGLTAGSTAFLLGFVVLLGLLAGMQGRPWAIWANLAAQLILVAGYVVYPAVGFMGLLFLVVWGSSPTCALRCSGGSDWASCPGNKPRRTDRYADRRDRACDDAERSDEEERHRD